MILNLFKSPIVLKLREGVYSPEEERVIINEFG
jgi:hypothetical protein